MSRISIFKKICLGLLGLSAVTAISLYIFNRSSIQKLDTRHLFDEELAEYIIPERPSSQILPGTVISYIDGREFVEADAEICFGKDKESRRTANTVFQSKSYSTQMNTGIGLWIFSKIFSNSTKNQVQLLSAGVSNVNVKFGNANIDYIELVKIRNLISAIDTPTLCRAALKNGAMIVVETISISSAEITIDQVVDDKQAILAEWNAETGLSANGNVSRVGKAVLDIKTPLSIGYKVVSLESLPVRAALQVIDRPVEYYYNLRNENL